MKAAFLRVITNYIKILSLVVFSFIIQTSVNTQTQEFNPTSDKATPSISEITSVVYNPVLFQKIVTVDKPKIQIEKISEEIPEVFIQEIAPPFPVKKPEAFDQNSWTIYYPSVGLYTSYENTVMSDFYTTKAEGGLDYTSLIDINDLRSSLQRKLSNSALHMAFTANPGEIGNSYFIGHNYNHFAPLMYNGSVGDKIVVKTEDSVFNYTVFEARTIQATNNAEAYQLGSTDTTITLQTCTNNPDVYWIVRARIN
jgi:hypothetical protein